MKNIFQMGKTVTFIFSGLLLISVIGLISATTSNKSNKNVLNRELLKNEAILSEKLELDKQIDKYKKENHALKIKNNCFNTLLFEAYIDFNQKNRKTKKLKQDKDKVKSLEEQLNDILKLNGDLKKKNDSFITVTNVLKKEKIDLNKKNNYLLNQINDLNDRIKDLITVVADNYRIESKNGKNNMLTILAKKTSLIQFGFDIPENINSDIKFRIINPKGYILQGSENDISYIIIDNPNNLTTSLSPEIFSIDRPKRIEMTFKPKEKLQFGIYKIEISNKDGLIGSCQFRLK